MPQLDLTELEAKVAWLILDGMDYEAWMNTADYGATLTLYEKLYRAYRGMKAA